MIHFTIPGKPKAKGRPRFGNGRAFTDKATQMYEAHARDSYLRAYPNTPPTDKPVAVTITFYLPRPKNHYGTGKNSHIMKESAPKYPCKVPDIDNLIKSVLDGLNKFAFEDDKQVIALTGYKFYAMTVPCVMVDINEMIPPAVTKNGQPHNVR